MLLLSSGSKIEAVGSPTVLVPPNYTIPCDIKPWEMIFILYCCMGSNIIVIVKKSYIYGTYHKGKVVLRVLQNTLSSIV
jgi:hypothetical protein